MKKDNFKSLSYSSHEKHYDNHLSRMKRLTEKSSVNYWRQCRMYNLLTPLLSKSSNDKWLTVGDGVGTDANWLFDMGVDAEASDISDVLLKMAHAEGFIKSYSKENAESLSYEENTFDYALCKEAYHHFPRPYIAVYEMLRVAKKGIVLIEPVDIGIQMPWIIFLKNVLDKISPTLIDKIWKNRYSFETVGNYVYKVSEREIEKIAMGINLPCIAFKGINDYYSPNMDLSNPVINQKAFSKVKSKIAFRNFFCKLGIIPYQTQSCIIFKEYPDEATIDRLKKDNYKFIKLKANPYLK
jgi:ubiquinone/menaquinone biosynthesis C-methylase UbiE